MSNVTVQEALTAAIELIQCFEAKLTNSQTAHSLPSEKVKRKLRDAISEIEKCEPVYQAREIGETDWENCTKEHYDYCKTIAHLDTRILDTSPQTDKKHEPFGYLVTNGVKIDFYFNQYPSPTFSQKFIERYRNIQPVWKSPQPREWVSLSDDDIRDVFRKFGWTANRVDFEDARAIEAKLKQLNTKG